MHEYTSPTTAQAMKVPFLRPALSRANDNLFLFMIPQYRSEPSVFPLIGRHFKMFHSGELRYLVDQ